MAVEKGSSCVRIALSVRCLTDEGTVFWLQRKKVVGAAQQNEAGLTAPARSFVVCRGREAGTSLKELRDNLRTVLSPHCARNLKVSLGKESPCSAR